MDYAMEYALMSDIYDEMTEANEGFFGKLGKFLSGLWNIFLKKLENLGAILFKKPVEVKKANQEDKSTIKPTGEKGIFVGKDGTKYREFIDPKTGKKALMTINSENKTKAQMMEDEIAANTQRFKENIKIYEAERRGAEEEREKQRKKQEAMKSAREYEELQKRKDAEEEREKQRKKQEAIKRRGGALATYVSAQETYNHKLKAVSLSINKMAVNVDKLIQAIHAIFYHTTNNYRTEREIYHRKDYGGVNNELEAEFDKANDDCDLVVHEASEIINELKQAGDEYTAARQVAIEAGFSYLKYGMGCSEKIGGVLEFINDQNKRVLQHDIRDTVSDLKRYKDGFDSNNPQYVNNRGLNSEMAKQRETESETIRRGLAKLNVAFGKVDTTICTLSKVTTYYYDSKKAVDVLKSEVNNI